MRALLGVSVAFLLVIALLTPGLSYAQQLPVPLVKVIYPGQSTVVYAGETFIFATTVKLSAKFEFVTSSELQLTIRTSPTHRQGAAPAAPGQMLRIYWQDGDEVLYDGEPPDEWSGIVLTEGGFTEK